MGLNNEKLIEGLQELTAFIIENDDFNFTEGSFDDTIEFNYRTWYLDGNEKEVGKAKVADLVRRLGNVDKSYGDEFAWMRAKFGPHVRFGISAHREVVCERVVTGKKVIPAHDGYYVAPAPEHEVEIVEWKCSPILADPVEA